MCRVGLEKPNTTYELWNTAPLGFLYFRQSIKNPITKVIGFTYWWDGVNPTTGFKAYK